MKLNNVTELVRSVLEQQPETRNSDNLLYIEVLARCAGQNVLNMPLWAFYQHQREWELPSIETVGRARRKLQQHHTELRANEKIEGFRTEQAEEYKTWSRGVV